MNQALRLVESHDSRNAKLRAGGKPEDPDTEEVMQARFIVEKMKIREHDKAKKRLGIEESKPAPASPETTESLVEKVLADGKAMELLTASLADRVAAKISESRSEVRPLPPVRKGA